MVDTVSPPLKAVDEREPVPKEAVARVIKTLKKREAQLQLDIIQLMPLVKYVFMFARRHSNFCNRFSQVEPSLVKPFNAKAVG